MSDPFIFHMCDASQLSQATKDNGMYFSPTFAADGFIHATANPAFLLEAGNHFYKAVKGDWVCIKLDVAVLAAAGSKVVYEAPAPVGAIEAVDYVKEHDLPEGTVTFPHIYGGIPAASVVQTFRIVRSEDGGFVSIEGLVGDA